MDEASGRETRMKLWLKSLFPPRDLGWNRVRAVCAQPDCHNKLLMRMVPGSRHGISVGEQWYCSADCFSLAARGTLASLGTAEAAEVPRNPRLSLGLALLTKGFLTAEQFRHAMAKHESEGVDFELTVTRLGWATEKQLAAARALQWGYPVLGQDLSGHSVIADLPPLLFRTCSATPLYYSSETRRLVLGFVHHVDHPLLQSIEQITGCRAEPCFITPAELTWQLERLAGPRRYEQVVVDDPGTVPQMARTLGAHALRVSAFEAAFARCHSFIWARLAGNKGTVDVLFNIRNAEGTSPVVYVADAAAFPTTVRHRSFNRRAHPDR